MLPSHLVAYKQVWFHRNASVPQPELNLLMLWLSITWEGKTAWFENLGYMVQSLEILVQRLLMQYHLLFTYHWHLGFDFSWHNREILGGLTRSCTKQGKNLSLPTNRTCLHLQKNKQNPDNQRPDQERFLMVPSNHCLKMKIAFKKAFLLCLACILGH